MPRIFLKNTGNRALSAVFSLIVSLALGPAVKAGVSVDDALGELRSFNGSPPSFMKNVSEFPGEPDPARQPESLLQVKKKSAVANLELPKFAFSDETDISKYLIDCINTSEESIELALYSFSLDEVTEALVAAQKRGVRIRIVFDQEHVCWNCTREIERLVRDGGSIDIRMLRGTGETGIMHNKMGIFDGRVLVMGSANWTKTARDENYENLMFWKNKVMVKGFSAYFNWMWSVSRKLTEEPFNYGYIQPGSFGKPPKPGKGEGAYAVFNGRLFPRYAFSPSRRCVSAIEEAIAASKEKIDIAVFGFFSEDLARALVRARNRGVKVCVIMEKTQARHSVVTKILFENNINVRIMRGRVDRGMMHHKYAVFDGAMLATGSFNWSYNADNNNFENLCFVKDSDIVAGFEAKFREFFEISRRVKRRDVESLELSSSALERMNDHMTGSVQSTGHGDAGDNFLNIK